MFGHVKHVKCSWLVCIAYALYETFDIDLTNISIFCTSFLIKLMKGKACQSSCACYHEIVYVCYLKLILFKNRNHIMGYVTDFVTGNYT